MNPALIKTAEKILMLIASNPDALGKFLEKAGTMPNIKMKPMNMGVFWDELTNHNGFKLQKNNVFGNCRILNPNGERIAWGGETALKEMMESFLKEMEL